MPPVRDALDAPTMPLGRSPRAEPIAAVVRVINPHGVRSFRLGTGACRVGSDPQCEITIPEPTVSRQHLELTLAPEGVKLRDLGSRNGTFYLGQRVERMTVTEPSFIRTDALPEQSDFRLSTSEWTLEPEESGTSMTYRLVMEPDFWVPPLIGPWVLKQRLARGGRGAINRIERLAREVASLPVIAYEPD